MVLGIRERRSGGKLVGAETGKLGIEVESYEQL